LSDEVVRGRGGGRENSERRKATRKSRFVFVRQKTEIRLSEDPGPGDPPSAEIGRQLANPASFLAGEKRESESERGPRAGGPPFRGNWVFQGNSQIPLRFWLAKNGNPSLSEDPGPGNPPSAETGPLSIFSARPIKAAYSVFLRVDSRSRFCSCRSPIFSSEPSHQPRSHVARHAGSRICATPTTTMSHRLAGGTRTKFTNAESIVSQVFDHQSVCRLLRVTVPVAMFG